MSENSTPIGIFDSGVGGLTVARQIVERLPGESIIYLGDTARLPYGTKSEETVLRYASACARVLLERGIKLLVVACNTASAFALEALRDTLDIPVIGVVEPGARTAVEQTRSHRVGVIGTEGTILSAEYQNAVQRISPKTKVFTKSCPLFVPLAEEGWTTGNVPMQIASTYLADLQECDIDTLVLGCTHYPLLASVIAETLSDTVTLIDSAEATAHVVDETLQALSISADHGGSPRHQFLVSDAPDTFARIGRNFFNKPIGHVEWVDF